MSDVIAHSPVVCSNGVQNNQQLTTAGLGSVSTTLIKVPAEILTFITLMDGDNESVLAGQTS